MPLDVSAEVAEAEVAYVETAAFDSVVSFDSAFEEAVALLVVFDSASETAAVVVGRD